MGEVQSELPTLEGAQQLKVFRKQAAVSDEEIDSVLGFEVAKRAELGTARRDAQGFKTLDASWITSYLHTDHAFQAAFPGLVDKLIDAALEADKEQGWGLLGGDASDLRIRVIELHRVARHGALAESKHHDHGSLVTVDVMCSSTEEFTGGQFTTLERDGHLQPHQFEKGDAVVFPSHKYHCVQPVKGGERVVLVMELWRGEERSCAHRCLDHFGPCTYSVAQGRVERLLTAAHPEIDPW